MITGFRVARGGAQERLGVTPDLTILGKIVGGGLPLAAFGGRAEIMRELAPVGVGLPGGHALRATRSRPRPGSRCCAACATRRSTRSSSGAAPGSRPGSPACPGRGCSASARWRRSSWARRPGAELRGRAALRHRALRRALPRPARARDLPRPVAVRVHVRLARPRRRGDRPDDRGRCRPPRPDVLDAIVPEAARESSLWADARSPAQERELVAVFSPLARRARSGSVSRRSTRPISSTSADRACSLRRTPTPRSCSATTSTRTGSCGSPSARRDGAVADLAELISLCGQLRAEDRAGDGAAWAASAALLGAGALAEARDALGCERRRAARAARARRRRRRGGRARPRGACRTRRLSSRRCRSSPPTKASASCS